MLLEYVRTENGRMVLDGAFGVIYNVSTVDQIDGNLSDLRWHPGHPDIDRLLDARKWVKLLTGARSPQE